MSVEALRPILRYLVVKISDEEREAVALFAEAQRAQELAYELRNLRRDGDRYGVAVVDLEADPILPRGVTATLRWVEHESAVGVLA